MAQADRKRGTSSSTCHIVPHFLHPLLGFHIQSAQGLLCNRSSRSLCHYQMVGKHLPPIFLPRLSRFSSGFGLEPPIPHEGFRPPETGYLCQRVSFWASHDSRELLPGQVAPHHHSLHPQLRWLHHHPHYTSFPTISAPQVELELHHVWHLFAFSAHLCPCALLWVGSAPNPSREIPERNRVTILPQLKFVYLCQVTVNLLGRE